MTAVKMPGLLSCSIGSSVNLKLKVRLNSLSNSSTRLEEAVVGRSLTSINSNILIKFN